MAKNTQVRLDSSLMIEWSDDTTLRIVDFPGTDIQSGVVIRAKEIDDVIGVLRRYQREWALKEQVEADKAQYEAYMAQFRGEEVEVTV